MEIKKVMAYQTADGKMFDDLVEAKTHQRDLTVKANTIKLVEDKCYEGMRKSDIIDFIVENQGELYEIVKLTNNSVKVNVNK